MPVSKVEWDWILRHIWCEGSADNARVDIPDTAVCAAGSVAHYIFTTPGGSLAAKTGRATQLDNIKEEFICLSIAAHGMPSNSPPEVLPLDSPVCLVHKQGGDVIPFDVDKFTLLCKNGPTADFVAIQAYIGRGPVARSTDGVSFANLRHEYRLSPVGVPSTRALLLGSEPVLCLSRPFNEAMGRNVSALVRLIESQKKSRVVQMVTEFVVDASARVWLLRTTDCLIAVDGPAVVAKPSEDRRVARISASPAIGHALTMAGGQRGGSEADNYGVDVKRGRGANSEVRAARRRARDPAPDEDAVQRVLAELAPNELPAPQAPQATQLGRKTSTLEVRDAAKSSAASLALGSTQLNGCAGDFCGERLL